MNLKILLTTVLFLFTSQIIFAQTPVSSTVADDTVESKIARNTVISGTVIDEKTKQPIPSATVRIENSNRGTIAGKDGTFRLPKGNFTNKSNIRITAVGYNSKTVTLDLTKDTVIILLTQNPVMLKQATVIGEINADEIIRRAIRKKDENRRKYNTIQGLLYSKITIDIAKHTANLISLLENPDSSPNFTFTPKTAEDSLRAMLYQGIIAETFARKYIDVEKNIDHTLIENRRQTANFPANINRVALDRFVDFSQDEIEFLDARIITPLHRNALSHYKFELIERKMFDDKYVYVLNVIPNTRVYPTFQGTISILEGTYQLIEARLRPSENTKIHMIENVEYYVKFENVGDDIWYQTYMENKAKLKMKMMPFVPPIEMDWSLTAIFSDIVANQPLPDSVYYRDSLWRANHPAIYSNNNHRIRGHHNNVDSARSEFWEDNALIALTEREQEMYAQIDTVAKELNIDADSLWNSEKVEPVKKKFEFDFKPLGRYNRVENWAVGLAPTVKLPYTKISGRGLYSWGQKDVFGSAKIEFGTGLDRTTNVLGLFPVQRNYATKPYFSVGGEIFSRVEIFKNPFSRATLMGNSFSVLFSHRDNFDYFRSDGWNTDFRFDYKNFKFSTTFENRQDFGLDKTTDKSLFSKKEFRKNPPPETGKFQLIKLQTRLGNEILSLSENFQYLFDVNYQFGIRNSSNSTVIAGNDPQSPDKNFQQISGTVSLHLPIFQTGYGNILLLLSASGGLAEHHSPVQHLFLMQKNTFLSNLLVPSDNSFFTAYETYFGGTDFYSYHLRLNLRDWWWRLLHLPTIKGRGLELSFSATTGKFFNKGTTELSQLYNETVDGFYSELGVRLGRIPIPGTDLIYWSFETRFGIGEYARGRWGFLLNFNLPFSF